MNEDIYQVVEDAGLDEDQQRKLDRALGQQYHLITREERLDKVAGDIVRQFAGRGFKGTGMVVCIDKLTAAGKISAPLKGISTTMLTTAPFFRQCSSR